MGDLYNRKAEAGQTSLRFRLTSGLALIRLKPSEAIADAAFIKGSLVRIKSSEGGRMPAKRTTHRSSKGTKLYAVRDAKGRFVDIQSYSAPTPPT
jgi:hypothetical protein